MKVCGISAGGHAVIIDQMKRAEGHTEPTDADPARWGTDVLRIPVRCDDARLSGVEAAFVEGGSVKVHGSRRTAYESVVGLGLRMAAALQARAVVPPAERPGAVTMVLASGRSKSSGAWR